MQQQMVTLRDLYVAIIQRKKLFFTALVFFLVAGGLFLVRRSHKLVLTAFIQPASYMSAQAGLSGDGGDSANTNTVSVQPVQSMEQLLASLQSSVLDKAINQFDTKNKVSLSPKQIKVSIVSASPQLTDNNQKKTSLPFLKLQYSFPKKQEGLYKQLMKQILQGVISGQAVFVNFQKQRWQDGLALFQQQYTATKKYIDNLQSQQPMVDKTVNTILLGPQAASQNPSSKMKAPLGRVSSLSDQSIAGLVQAANAGRVLQVASINQTYIYNASKDLINSAAKMQRIKSELDSLQDAQVVSVSIEPLAIMLPMVLVIIISIVLSLLIVWVTYFISNQN